MKDHRLVSALSDATHECFREEVRQFAETVVRPNAARLEASETFPREIIRKMGERCWMGIPIPSDDGGAGLDNLSYIIAVEELARISGSVAITLAAHTSLVVWPILKHGTVEQKRKYLPSLSNGQQIGSFGLTENNAGSDAGATDTTAIADGNEYIINGSKRFITNGTFADIVIITASHDRSKGRIPKANLIGEENEGFKVFMETLDGGRISIGALALGEAQGALDAAVNYIREKDLQHSQTVQKSLADMAIDVAAARHLIYHAARLKDQTFKVTLEGAMAKCYASEAAMRVTSKAVSLMGMSGLTKQYRAEQFYRDAKLNEIGEGTSEIQRIVIARQLIGK